MNKKVENLSDLHLIEQMQSGDKNAMSEVYLKYYPIVFNRCLTFSNDRQEANDLTHDIMLKMIENIQTFKGSSKFSTWLYSITFHYCLDQKAKKEKHMLTSLNFSDSYFAEFGEDKENLEEAEVKIGRALKVLSDIEGQDRNLLLMKYHEKKSIEELQKVYNISASAVKMRLLRAREKAINLLKSELQLSKIELTIN